MSLSIGRIMKNNHIIVCGQNQQGNVIFLVLVAVVLFAALTYAVSFSSRTSVGGTGETMSISSGALLQYTASLRSAMAGLQFKGKDVTEMEFNFPKKFDGCTHVETCIFHSEGGGVSYIPVSEDIMMSGISNNNWGFTALFEVKDIGTSEESDFAGNDPVAFVYGVSGEVCKKIHEKLDIEEIPVSTIDDGIFESVLDISDYHMAAAGFHMDTGWEEMSEEIVIGCDGTEILAGRSQGCFKTAQGYYVFYSVLQER